MTQTEALLISYITEIPICLLIMRRLGVNFNKALFAGVIATSLTHPVAWSISRLLSENEYLINIIVIELFVIVFEMLIYKTLTKIKWMHSLIISLISNLASALSGFIFY